MDKEKLAASISELRSQIPLTNEELLDLLQPALVLVKAFIAIWASANSVVLTGDKSFESYAAKFPSRRQAIETLGTIAWDELMSELGQKQIEPAKKLN